MPGNNDVLDGIKGLVNQNEVELALEQLKSLLRGIDSNLYNEAILHSSRLLEVRKRERRGLLSSADAQVQRNKISFAVLDLLDDVTRQLKRKLAPVPPGVVSFEPPEDARLEKVFGINHLKSIAWLQRGLEAAGSVCRIVTPTGLGTGFVVKDNKLLTNHHVIPDASVAEASRVEFNYEEDSNTKLKSSYSYRLRASTIRANADLDYALVEIEEESKQRPLDSWGYLQLEMKVKPKTGEHVTVIQHPQGGPKQIALTANQVVNVFDHRLQYTTDTLPGSSGSPVFNDDWKVVALHHAGGNLLSNPRGDRMFANEGILVDYIVKDLEE